MKVSSIQSSEILHDSPEPNGFKHYSPEYKGIYKGPGFLSTNILALGTFLPRFQTEKGTPTCRLVHLLPQVGHLSQYFPSRGPLLRPRIGGKGEIPRTALMRILENFSGCRGPSFSPMAHRFQLLLDPGQR